MLTVRHVQQGFSAIELMVGIVIVSILLALAAPSFSSWVSNNRIRAAGESMLNGLQLARSEAVRRNTQIQFVLGTDTGWNVGCTTVTADCPATIQNRSSAEGSTASVIMASDQTTAVFNGLGREVNANPLSSICLGSTAGLTSACLAPTSTSERRLRVEVTPGGQIRMCNPSYAVAANPQGC
ncbi:MAG: GspH/FimT family pseudopilin [Nitrosomonadales bacterium]|nr:GspH/FimT family pseudopilin [Nitrosomonadales bacterium]